MSRALTRDEWIEKTARLQRELFPRGETVPLSVNSELDRLIVQAGVFADDLRYLPEFGLMTASTETRYLFAFGLCRLRRRYEAERVSMRGRNELWLRDAAREPRWPRIFWSIVLLVLLGVLIGFASGTVVWVGPSCGWWPV